VASFHKALKKDKCLLRHRDLTTEDIKAIAVALVVCETKHSFFSNSFNFIISSTLFFKFIPKSEKL
jgi:hypothetical protein